MTTDRAFDNASREGTILFIEGVPSSGKTSTAREIKRRVDELEVIHGDDLIKKWGRRREFSPAVARAMFERLLDVIDAASSDKDVIVDASIPEGYLAEARTRFPNAVFVSLRVSERERRSRERKRSRRNLTWNPEIAASQANEGSFDLVIDTTESSPAECAEKILAYLDQEAGDNLG